MMNYKLIFSTCCLLFVMSALSAQIDYDIVPDVTEIILIKDAQIAEELSEKGMIVDILIDHGVIKDIADNIEPPINSRIIEADSSFVYPSFIDGLSHTGNQKKKETKEKIKVRFPGNPPNDVVGITPEFSIVDKLNYTDSRIKELREAGFAISHSAPEGKMLPGKSAIILLNGHNDGAIILKKDHAQFFQFSGTRGYYPSTRIGVMAKWRDLVTQARYLDTHSSYFNESPKGIRKARFDNTLDALVPVSKGLMPVYKKATKIKTVFQAVELKKQLSYNMVLVDVKQGWNAIKDIKEQDIPVLLSLSVPKEMKKKKKKKDGKKVAEMSPESKLLKERKKNSLQEYNSQAAEFEKANIPFGFSMLSTSPKDVRKNLNIMIEAGLSKKQALKALTINAAKILNIDAYTGSLEIGKAANMFLSDKDYFEKDAHITMSIIGGELFKFPKKEKPKGSADINGIADISGNWSYSVEVDGEYRTGNFTIGKDDNPEIKFTSDEDPTVVNIGRNISFESNVLSFSLDIIDQGIDRTLNLDLTFTTEDYEGSVEIEGIDTYPISGQKISSPE